MRIGLIGYGGVAKAFHHLLENKKELKNEYNLSINYIINSKGGVYHENDISTTEKLDWSSSISFDRLIKDDSIEVVVELTSTSLEDGQPGLYHMTEALKNNKHVITGNKGPLVLCFQELIDLALKHKKQLKYGCTVGGALPTLSLSKSGLLGSRVLSIEGILNGTSNFILEDMLERSHDFKVSLAKAIKLGIAEKNSLLDTGGWDTACKMIILTNSLIKTNYTLKDAEIRGLESISPKDIDFALKNNKVIKLIGNYDAIKENPKIIVKPCLLDKNHELSFISGKNKGIVFRTDTLGDIHLSGGASGTRPAAGGILRDLLELIRENTVL